MAFECCELNHLATFCRDCFPRPLKLLFFFQGLITTNNLLAMEGSHRFRRRRCQRVVKKPSLQSICSWWGAKGGAGDARWFQLPSGFNLGKFFKKPKSNQSHPINWSFSSWETMSFGCFVSVKPIQVFQTSGNSGTF